MIMSWHFPSSGSYSFCYLFVYCDTRGITVFHYLSFLFPYTAFGKKEILPFGFKIFSWYRANFPSQALCFLCYVFIFCYALHYQIVVIQVTRKIKFNSKGEAETDNRAFTFKEEEVYAFWTSYPSLNSFDLYIGPFSHLFSCASRSFLCDNLFFFSSFSIHDGW